MQILLDARITEGRRTLTKLFCRIIYFIRLFWGSSKWFFLGSGPVRIHKGSLLTEDAVAIVTVLRGRPDIIELLSDLKAAGYGVLLVFNRHDIEPPAAVLAAADVVLSRKNKGRDFGAYAKGVELVGRFSTSYKKILFINDSCVYLKRSVDLFRAIRELPHHYVCLTETWRYGRYLTHGNFFQLSKQILMKTDVRRFFLRYKQITSPRYAVEQGEKKLCRILIGRVKANPFVMFPIHMVVNQRKEVAPLLDEYGGWYGLNEPSVQFLGRSKANLLARGAASEVQLERLRMISSLDPMQDVALLLPVMTAFPFLKINNLARGYCSFQQLRQFALKLSEPARSRVIHELTNTYGRYHALTGFQRFLRFAELWSLI